MNPQVANILFEQLQVFAISILYGLFSGTLYGALRVFRKVFTHRDTLVHIEDIFYCILQTFGMFFITQIFNYGMIRMYIIFGIFLGAVVYFYWIGPRIEKFFIKLFRTIFCFLGQLFRIIFMPHKIILTFFLKSLKKMKRTVKIIRNNQ